MNGRSSALCTGVDEDLFAIFAKYHCFRFKGGCGKLARRCFDVEIIRPILYQDRCCQDVASLEGFREVVGGLDVRLDNAHLLARYGNSLSTSKRKESSHLMRNLAKLLVGESKDRTDQRNGADVYYDFSSTLEEFDKCEAESGISLEDRMITSDTWRVHADQKVHFSSCIGGLDDDHLEIERFENSLLKRGTNGLENFFRHTKRIMPEVCGKELGVSTLLAHVID